MLTTFQFGKYSISAVTRAQVDHLPDLLPTCTQAFFD